jgi:amidase
VLHRVGAEQRSYVFAIDAEPVLRIRSGDEVVFETVDARGGRAMNDYDSYVVPPPPPYDRLNPVTGPVAVEGAETWDTLAVEVEAIKLGSKGYTAIRTDQGVLKDLVTQSDVLITKIADNRIVFSDSLFLAVRPMIGTIGVAPTEGRVPSVYPGPHGGNMDCNDIRSSSKVYLPVNADGALFALGDVHASMGDGETSGAGLDIGADVTVKLGLLKGVRIESPIVETESHVDLVHNSPKLEDAIRGVVLKAVSLLESTRNLSRMEAIALVSVAGDLGVCQAAMSRIDAVVRMRLPKDVANLGKLGIR